MSAVTTFVTRHTRHATPVIAAAAVFIGSSYLNTFDEAMDKLDMIASPTPWQRKKPLVRALVSALATWGALLNQSIANRRKKLEGDTQPAVLTEEEFFRRHAQQRPQEQPPVQPPKP